LMLFCVELLQSNVSENSIGSEDDAGIPKRNRPAVIATTKGVDRSVSVLMVAAKSKSSTNAEGGCSINVADAAQ
jgi:hypothetical protein